MLQMVLLQQGHSKLTFEDLRALCCKRSILARVNAALRVANRTRFDVASAAAAGLFIRHFIVTPKLTALPEAFMISDFKLGLMPNCQQLGTPVHRFPRLGIGVATAVY